MAKYVALIRGIGPGDSAKSNESLRQVFEKLGFTNVQSIITSGNIIFDSKTSDTDAMEKKIEAAWPKLKGFTATTLVRSADQLQKLIDADPYKGLSHSNVGTYLLVTFFKKPTKMPFALPYQPKNKPFTLVSVVDNTLFTVTDNTQLKTPDLMTWLEKQFTKELSSRTWLTLQRILKKMNA